MKVLLSIHDVTPALGHEVELLWTMCRHHGATPALLVVPDWHGQWPLEANDTFVKRLMRWQADGADVLLHGLRHDEVGSRRGWRDDVRAVGRTAREGEFLTLSRGTAAVRIRQGVRRLKALSLDPCGFVPPAWLMRPGSVEAVQAAGLSLTEDTSAIYLVPTAATSATESVTRVRTPVWRWSARTTLRAYGSVAITATRRWASRSRTPSLLRVALHPTDLRHRSTRRSLMHTLEHLATHAHWQRYRELGERRHDGVSGLAPVVSP